MCRRQLLTSERELREHRDDNNIGSDTDNNETKRSLKARAVVVVALLKL